MNINVKRLIVIVMRLERQHTTFCNRLYVVVRLLIAFFRANCYDTTLEET